MYAYAGNDPVNWSDPLGLSPCPPNYYGCGNTFGLPGITVRAGGWYTSMIDVRGGLRDLWSGGTSIMAGMVKGTWQDDASGPELKEVEEENDPRACPRAIGSALLSLGLDVMTLYPGVAAFRAWRAAKDMPALLQTGQLLGRAAHDAAIKAAASEFRSTVVGGVAGVSMGTAQTVSEGATWRYAIPILGTGERIGDAPLRASSRIST